MVRSAEGLDKMGQKIEAWWKANSRPLRRLASDSGQGGRRIGFGGRSSSQRVRVLHKGETGMKPSEIDHMSNEQARAWLETLEADTMVLDLSDAKGCRKMRAGLRVVK